MRLTQLTRTAYLLIALSWAFPTVAEEGTGACNDLTQLSWLNGVWESRTDKRITQEHWQLVSTKTMEGSGQTLRVADNSLANEESLRLVAMLDGIYYLAKVGHNALPIAFKQTECSASRAVFENPAHDFPQRIEYKLASQSAALTVQVSDLAGKGFELQFKRLQLP